ncbi:MAG: hypothetical protein HOZ81_11020 [Streptomyces sp.]|nr:hypothetical protein [Streptomyces sp.]NUS24217.1 hypothetical protein [Streptomyces sp.]
MPETTVHAEPPTGSGLTPCCGRTPFELPRDHRMTNDSEQVTCSRTPEPWALDHQVHAFAQTESRPGPLTAEGERWMERQPTGKVMVVCTCGYSSGLIDGAELENTVAALQEGHAPALAQTRRSER